MRKWEEKYKRIQSAEFGKRMDELQEKFDKKTITRDEMKELESSKRQKSNIQKVDNVLEYKTKLEGQLKDIKAEQERRKSISDLKRESRNLDFELNTLKLRQASIEKSLGSTQITEEEKKGLRQELAGLKDKINRNQELFSKNYAKIENESNIKGKLTEISSEDLANTATSLSSKISKCNMICGKLVEGYSWDSIDMKLEQWKDREFKAPKGTAAKMRGAEESDRKFDFSRLYNDEKSPFYKGKDDGENKALVEVSEFDQKHPKLAKLKNFFKKIGKNIKEAFVGEPELNEKEEKDTKTAVATEKSGKDDFRDYIKVVAEKGMKEADKERLEAKKREAQQKIARQEQDKEEER